MVYYGILHHTNIVYYSIMLYCGIISVICCSIVYYTILQLSIIISSSSSSTIIAYFTRSEDGEGRRSVPRPAQRGTGPQQEPGGRTNNNPETSSSILKHTSKSFLEARQHAKTYFQKFPGSERTPGKSPTHVTRHPGGRSPEGGIDYHRWCCK